MFDAILKPEDMPEACPTADVLSGVAGQLGNHLHHHQIGIGACQHFQQALVTLHHPTHVGNKEVGKRLDLAAENGDAEGVRERIPPPQKGDGIPGTDGVTCGWPNCCSKKSPVIQILLGDAHTNVAKLAALFFGAFPGVVLQPLLNGCCIQQETHFVRFLANGRGNRMARSVFRCNDLFNGHDISLQNRCIEVY